MPLIDVPTVDPKDRSRGALSGAAWGPRLRNVDFTRLADGDVSVDVEAEVYQSLAAYSDGASVPDVVRFRLDGPGLRNLIREEPDAIAGLFRLVDKALKAKLGGTIVPAALHPWMTAEAEPEPEPEPAEEP